jgi:hypothetical protein
MKVKQNEIECNMTMLEMMAEIERLRKENQKLEYDNDLLHNIIENQNEMINTQNNDDPSLLGDYENDNIEIDYEAYANEFKNISLNRI